MKEILSELFQIGIIPVIDLADYKTAPMLAEALIAGAIPCAQVNFNSGSAVQTIKVIAKKYPSMLLGAGSVLSKDDVKAAVESGAKFIVTSGFNIETIKFCIDNNITVIPGCATAGEIESALSLGLDTVNFFPADAAGGVAMIEALSKAYPSVKFIAEGGIELDKLNDYLACKKVIACGGDWFNDLANAGKFCEVERLARQAVCRMLGFYLKHIGINSKDEEESSRTANIFENMFGFEKLDCGGAYFNSSFIEVMKKPFYGKNGHIGIGTNSMERAVYRFRKAGIPFNEASAGYNEDGSLRVVYFQDEVGGFAVHIVQK